MSYTCYIKGKTFMEQFKVWSVKNYFLVGLIYKE